MSINIKFEIENKPEREGVVAVDTYLSDAAKRLGVSLGIGECAVEGACADDCAVTILAGADNLSTPTSKEMHQLTDEQRANGMRLACQARLQRSGDVVVKVIEKVKEKTEAEKERDFRRDFQKLPLEKKFATLVEIEAVALSETVNFIANLPMTVGNQVVGLLAKFGWQIDKRERAARRPTEHRAEHRNAPQNKTQTEPAE